MTHYRLLVHMEQSGPVNAISINLRNRDEAFVVAQRYDGPAELWDEDKLLCTIRHSGAGVWMISEKGS